MEDLKTIIKTAYKIQQGLINLRKNQLIETLQRISALANQFKDLAVESKRASLALTKNWLSSDFA